MARRSPFVHDGGVGAPAALRVLVADDHAPTLDQYASYLRNAGVEVVATCADGAEAIAAAAETAPDVCLLDVQMPGANGVDVTREIVTRNPAVSVVLVTTVPSDDGLFDAIHAGAHGYIAKGFNPVRLAAIVRGVAAGETAFPRALLRGFLAAAVAS